MNPAPLSPEQRLHHLARLLIEAVERKANTEAKEGEYGCVPARPLSFIPHRKGGE